MIRIVGEHGSSEMGHMSVVHINPLEQRFWDRIKGAMDVGFSFARANRVTQWNLAAEARYRSSKITTKVDFNSTFREWYPLRH